MHALREHEEESEDGCLTETLAECIDRSMQLSLLIEKICLFALLDMVFNSMSADY